MGRFASLAFTPAVKAVQQRMGSRSVYARIEGGGELFTHIARDAKAERAFVLRVEGFDWNCPQHITPRFTEEEVREMSRPRAVSDGSK